MKHFIDDDRGDWLQWPLVNIRKRLEIRCEKNKQKPDYRLFCVDLRDSLTTSDLACMCKYLENGESVCIKWSSTDFFVIELICPITEATRNFLNERGYAVSDLVSQDVYLLPNNENIRGMQFNALVVTDCVATLEKGGASIRLTDELMLPLFDCCLHFDSPFITHESCNHNREIVLEWLIAKLDKLNAKKRVRLNMH